MSEKSQRGANVFIPEIHLQPPFQPGSSPVHLLSRFMVKFFVNFNMVSLYMYKYIHTYIKMLVFIIYRCGMIQVW